ncbi:MAG: hypothetical protein GX614_02700 [Sandaracinaceae bacterium]|nr:hypothetical protein [Sandaracinaceae bacterium]
MSDGIKRTEVAQRAIDLGEALNIKLREMSAGSVVPKHLEVIPLDAESTRGGEFARQSIVLTPDEEGARGSIMCGWIDVSNRAAEMRDYALVRDQFRERYQMPLDVSREEYERLVGALHAVLSYHKFVFSRLKSASSPEPELPEIAGGESGGWLRMAVIVLVGCGVGLGIAYLLGS